MRGPKHLGSYNFGMCGRFTLQTPASKIAELFPGLSVPAITPRYNICPTQDVLCIRETVQSDDAAELADRETAMLRWGLVPRWAKDLKFGARTINSRSETAAEKPSFRSAMKKRRCLILADGFYEWQRIGKRKQPFYIHRQDRRPFYMAGLWESWRDPAVSSSDAPIETCTILTTDANTLMSGLHDRMPVVLPDDDAVNVWLDRDVPVADPIVELMLPREWPDFDFYAVSTTVNSVRNQGSDLIEPLNDELF